LVMTGAGFTIWLNGGGIRDKTELAQLLREELAARGVALELLDGKMGFEPRGQDQPSLRAAYAARMLNKHGIAAVVSSDDSCRDLESYIRSTIPHLVRINFGSSPSPDGETPELVLPGGNSDPQERCRQIVAKLEEMGLIQVQEAYTEDEKRG
jgi:hypothetical protein